MKKRLILILILVVFPILGIFLYPKPTNADQPLPYSRGDSYNTGITPGYFDPEVTERWRVPLSSAAGPPAISGNTLVYFDLTTTLTFEGVIRAKDVYSQAELWSYQTQAGVRGCPPAIQDGIVYTCDGDLVALDLSSGIKIATYNKPIGTNRNIIKVQPAGDTIIGFSYPNAYAVAYDRTNKNMLWQTYAQPPTLNAIIKDGKLIYTGNAGGNGFAIAINISNGQVIWNTTLYSSTSGGTFLERSNRLFDQATGKSVDANTGAITYSYITNSKPFPVDDKLIIYFNCSQSTNVCFIIKDINTYQTLETKPNVLVGEFMRSNPLLVDGKVNFISSKNRLVQFDLNGNLLNPGAKTLNENINPAGDIIIDHGRLIFYDHNNAKLEYFDKNFVITDTPATFSLKSPYTNNPGNGQYLGQLHCHYIPDVPWWNELWNGDPSPEFTVNKYRDAGYDFIALTEHNQIVPMPVSSGIIQIQNAMESTQGWGKHHILAVGISNEIDNDADDQTRLNSINAQGGTPIFAHPDSLFYGIPTRLLSKLSGLKLLEVYNTAVQHYSSYTQGNAIDDLDQLEGQRNHKYLTAGDDYTPGDGGFDGAAVMVFVPDGSQESIINALKSGNFYALQGSKAPRIENIIINDKSISISVSEPAKITFIGKGGKKLKVQENTSDASYEAKGDEIYVRIEVKAESTGLIAWSQPITIEETEQKTTFYAGENTLDLNGATLKSNSTAPVTAKIAATESLPSVTPPVGYLSPAYQLSTAGQILPGTTFEISYADTILPVNENNLSVFTYNETNNQWEIIPSFVDREKRVVRAELNHFSLYTLSAPAPEDTEDPSVSLASPTDLNNLSGTVGLLAEASDNEAVTKVQFLLDNRILGSDLEVSDGWMASFETTEFMNGNHQLTLRAEDYSGNVNEMNYDLTISGGIPTPSILISTPTPSDYLYESSEISGSFSSSFPAKEIAISLDGINVDTTEIDNDNKSFSKLINWNQFTGGSHKLKLELRDINDNTVSTEISINIGQNVSASIISPENKPYLRNSILPVNIETTPSDAEINIYLDGHEIGNDANLYLINYGLGEHSLEVKFRDNTLASVSFLVVTNYKDTIGLVKRLYSEGHFMNYGIAQAISSQFMAAELAHLAGKEKIEQTLLDHLILFIQQQSEGKKKKIDEFASRKLLEQISFLIES